MNSSSSSGPASNPPNLNPIIPNTTTTSTSSPFSHHFQSPTTTSTAPTTGTVPQNNGSGECTTTAGNNPGRGRSQTDTTLHQLLNNVQQQKFSASIDANNPLLPLMDSMADSTLPYKQRLYELFSLIEREMEGLHVENCALRARLEVQSGDRLPLNNELETTPRRPAQMSMNVNSSELVLAQHQSGIGGSGKKSTQSRQQKWKSAFKNPSGKLALKVGANFPAESKQHRFVQNFKGHADGVWQVCAAQWGSSTSLLASASADQTAKLWLADNGVQPLASYSGHTGSVNSVAIRPDSAATSRSYGAHSQLTVLTCSGDRSAHIWRLNLEQAMERRREKQQTAEGEEELFVQQVHQPLLKLTAHTDAIMDGDWLYGGEQIITVSWDRTAHLFDAESGKVLKTLSGHDQELTSCSAHPSQKLLATASRDFTFRLWDFREPIHSVAVFQGHNDSVTSVLFSALHHIVSGSDDRTVKVWDLRNMRSPISAIRLDSAANRIAICTKRNVLAIPMDNRNISVYDLSGNRQTRIPRSTGKCHHRLVTACAWLSEHPVNNLVTCGFDKQIIGWKVQLPAGAGAKT